ncbi:hypothetical protein F5887DRAFT_1287046 [Amanita rubescens]|nr:hypothetical protein F5887DRAFT_1287046 [Amanita rubescens]
MSDGFGETVSPIAAIRAILHDYPFSASIFRELLQNSDDAKATKQIFVLDMGKNGEDSAIMAYNDSQFREEDWNAIQIIHESSKRADTSKIGKYGLGFRACYHVTDEPQILSGPSFAILDPIRSGGKRMIYKNFEKSDHRKHFDFFLDISKPPSSPGMAWLPSMLLLFPNTPKSSFFPGTVIRLPLRSSPSELSEHVVPVKELDQMIQDYIDEELNISLLFLNSLRTVEIWKVYGANKTRLAAWTKSERKVERQSKESSLFIRNLVLSNGNTYFSWRIIQTKSVESDARSRLAAQVGGDTVNHVFERHKLSADVRIAYPLFSDGHTSGRLFTFLPLPSRTNFPVHIHALFALTSSRQSLRNRSEIGTVAGSDNDVLIKWNSLLFDHYIPQAWSRLLKTLTEDAVCKDIFSSWPPFYSSITSGDGLYWRNILPEMLKCAIQSGLAIWPKVSEAYTTTYVDLKSSVVVARDKVHSDVLIALARVGLTLVQMPETHMKFLDDSISKLTPHVARDQIERRSLEFNRLSQNQRRVLCEYFLSEKDFSSIYGLPLFPTLDGSYISLDNRDATSRRYIALNTDEVDAFRASAGGAISLNELPREVAVLVREKGTTQANIDLLSPQSAVAYLSSEPPPLSDQRLTKFWTWLEKWQQRDQTMVLLKSNTVLHLVPTSKGPQLVSSPAFPAPGFPLFEKLGLAFVSSVLPSTVVQFLNRHGVIKNIDDMNHFLAAINLAGLQTLGDDEAKLVFDHISSCYRSISSDNLAKLKKLPIFPVLVPSTNYLTPSTNAQSLIKCNTSVKWRTIIGLSVKGISPMPLIPLTDNINFLDKSSFSNPSCSLLQALQLPYLSDEDILLLALGQFSSQPKSLRALFVSYIRQNHRWTNSVTSVLWKTQFIHSSDGTLRSPIEVIDPNSRLKSLFLPASSDSLIPTMEDDYDREIIDDLRDLEAKASVSLDIVQERIWYISANHTSPEALVIARSLLSLMNDPSFVCASFPIDRSLRWLPTEAGLVSLKECIDWGRRDADLFDEVLITLDKSFTITPSFRALLGWDKPFPLNVLTKQLDLVLGQPNPDTQYRKINEIIRELATRQLGDADVKAIHAATAGRPWVPTKSGTLAPPSRAVFTSVVDSSCFHEICFSKAQKQIYMFLVKMGCNERPSAPAIISELSSLRKNAGTDSSIVQQALQLLQMLPDSITDKERASLLVPTDTGDLVPLCTGVCFYKGSVTGVDDGKIIAHHLITEKLAKKIGIQYLGVDEALNDIDLGGSPITLIRNTLRQYDPKQFFTEFIANASDAGAKRFSVLVDDHEGPTERLLSEELAVFQKASLVIYNDGIFSKKDFRGILQTGIGGKGGRTGVIGHFGLGALSMFHFTELAMIVSGDQVLFMSPSKQNLSFCGKHSVLLPLQSVKKLYPDHLKPLVGLFGFDLSFTKSYQGTLFRLPLRNESHSSQDPVSTTPWSVTLAQEMILTEFDKVAYKSLLFTQVGRIEVQKRQNGNIEPLRAIESVRVPADPTSGDSFKSETVTFESPKLQVPKWLVVTIDVNVPEKFKAGLAKKYDMHHLLPIRIAAALDNDQAQKLEYNLFCTLPLPVATPLLAHISAPLILEQDRRNVRIDSDRTEIESEYNQWLLSSELPRSYLCLLEMLLRIQGTNIAWWPGAHNIDVNYPSRIFMNAFWSSEILKESSRRVFASKYNPTSLLSPDEVVLYANKANEYTACSTTLPKVLSATQPLHIAELPVQLFDYAKKALRIVDGPFLKTLLEHADPLSLRLTVDEMNSLLWYLLQTIELDGLPLILLEDGSCAKIRSQFTQAYYIVGEEQNAAYHLFRPNRLVHRKFTASKDLLKVEVNVSRLDNAGVAELVEDRIGPDHERSGDEIYQAWVAAFWDARLNVSLESISHLPLIQTIQPSKFISISRIDHPAVTIVDAERSYEDFDFAILQKLGMTIVLRRRIPENSPALERKKLTPYKNLLEYVQKNEAKGLDEILSLKSNDRDELARWVRFKFSQTPQNLADIALKLPVWPIQQRAKKPPRLGALKDAIVLPAIMPCDNLLPFIDRAVINWEKGMEGVMKDEYSAKAVTELLRVSPGTIIRSPTERAAYKQFVKAFLKFKRVEGYSLLVPNEEGVLTPVESLFECHRLFSAAFKASPERFLPVDFQDIAGSLGDYGLKLRNRLDLAMFIECAKAFDQDNDDDDDDESGCEADNHDKRRRSEVLYRYFNNLSLSPSDVGRCPELDGLKFIPRDFTRRPGYEGMNIKRNKRDDILSPSKITLTEYEPICWSQRGAWVNQLEKKLQVKHLKVLVELGKKYGHRSALLSDLKATYKWLNENVDEILADIKNENRRSIFLNVDNPESDPWAEQWHAASNLVKDLQDVGDMHDVKGFLRNYDNLLKAAGVRTIQKVKAEPVAAQDRTVFHRSRFREMRERGFEVNVTFKAMDNEHQIGRAHKAWLSLNSEYFWRKFVVIPDFPGKRTQVPVDVSDCSSLCVKETIDWIYVGELPESIKTNPKSDEESETKLDLALGMLNLAHRWEIAELHLTLQDFIINEQHFINPYSVRDVREHAEKAKANKLSEACKEFEDKNQEIIDDAQERKHNSKKGRR